MGFFSKDISTMDDLFVHMLRDIYYAEQEILKALPTMIEKATNPELKSGLQQHLAETRNHVHRVEQVFEMHGVEAQIVNCPAINGIIKEADEIAGDAANKEVLDAEFIPSNTMKSPSMAHSCRGPSNSDAAIARVCFTVISRKKKRLTKSLRKSPNPKSILRRSDRDGGNWAA